MTGKRAPGLYTGCIITGNFKYNHYIHVNNINQGVPCWIRRYYDIVIYCTVYRIVLWKPYVAIWER